MAEGGLAASGEEPRGCKASLPASRLRCPQDRKRGAGKKRQEMLLVVIEAEIRPLDKSGLISLLSVSADWSEFGFYKS